MAFGFAVLAGVVAWWAWRAYHEPLTLDTGLAYQGGQVAWATGHPERLATWISTPFLGAVMAVATRLMSASTAATLMTTLNLLLVVGSVVAVLHRLRAVLSPTWWWITAFALLTFGPMMSSVWWKQFNIVSVVLAVAGFELLRQRRQHTGAIAIGLSIAIKPLAILLPFVLLARRETRRAGAWALGYLIALNVAGQAFMALRAHNLATLNVLPVLQDFGHKSRPANLWSCVSENFAPGSLACRLFSAQYWSLEHLVVWAAVALLGAWVVDALRGRRALSWEVFAFTCALSTMVSPIAWSHYQIMLTPLFVLVVVRFSREGAGVGMWAGLAAAFFLASLMWQPYGTLIGAVHDIVAGGVQTQRQLLTVEQVAQFAQYVLLITGVLWFVSSRPLEKARSSPEATRAYVP